MYRPACRPGRPGRGLHAPRHRALVRFHPARVRINNRLAQSDESAHQIRQFWRPQIAVRLVEIRFVSRVAIKRALVRVNHWHVDYLHPLIVSFIVIGKLRLHGHNVTPIGKISPAPDYGGRADQIIFFIDFPDYA